jgi:hypothetical protein
MAVPGAGDLVGRFFVVALPFFFECRQITIRSVLFELVGFLISTAAMCWHNFAAGCLAALVMNRSHSRKNFVL